MNEHEEWMLETLVENFSTRIGQALREERSGLEMLADDGGLTPEGEAWVQGYLTAHMSIICNATSGNPNLSAEQVEAIADTVRERGDEIAAELYS